MNKNLIIIFLLIFSLSSYSQNKNAEKEQYKIAKKEQNATQYLDYFKKYFPFGNYINKAQKDADNIVYSDAISNNKYKQLIEYKKYFPKGIHQSMITSKLDEIASNNLKGLIKSDSYDDLNKFIEDHPDANKQIEKIKERIKFLDHKKEYSEVQKKDSFDEYILFMKYNRKSIYYDEILNKLLAVVIKNNKVSDIKRFLYVSSDKKLNEDVYKQWWKIVSENNTKKEYSELMANTPKSNEYYIKSQNAVYDIEFLDVIQQNDVNAYREFVKNNKENTNINKVKALLKRKDIKIFKDAKEKNTSAAYKNYISLFPKGKFIKEAEEGLKNVSSTEKSNVTNVSEEK